MELEQPFVSPPAREAPCAVSSEIVVRTHRTAGCLISETPMQQRREDRLAEIGKPVLAAGRPLVGS